MKICITARLKWKPSDENSVDFRVKILNPSDEKPVYELYLGFRGSEEHFYGNFEPDPDLLKEYSLSMTYLVY